MMKTLIIISAAFVLQLAMAKPTGRDSSGADPAPPAPTAPPAPPARPLTYCKSTKQGTEYRGRQNKTVNGYTCQRWDNPPNPPSQMVLGLLNTELRGAENFCRNPTRDDESPWCYTTDSDKRWDYCDIPYCPLEDCKVDEQGIGYRGWTATTESGLTCQSWHATAPHKPNPVTEKQLNTTLIDAENFCRNPTDGDRPWCYTTSSTRWEYCAVPSCPTAPTPAGPNCRTTLDGQGYRGGQNTTKSGRTCQRWASQIPHEHSSTDEDWNYCRNPSESDTVWCYTTDGDKRWEYCDVPICEGLIKEPTVGGCGQRPDLPAMIVGGQPSGRNTWPWQVSLQQDYFSRHFCGGSIISSWWIMTAAHCVVSYPKPDWIVAGAYNLNNSTEPSRQKIQVAEIHVNPDYDDGATLRDIALIKLESELDFGEEVSPVCIPREESGDDLVGEKFAITGWGTTEKRPAPSSDVNEITSETDNEVLDDIEVLDDNDVLGDSYDDRYELTPDPLMEARVPIVSKQQCDQWLVARKERETTLYEICAGYEEGGTDSCQGDSGGPMVADISGTQQYEQIGITSWGLGCADVRSPGVYARVAAELKFIKETTWGDYHVAAGPEGTTSPPSPPTVGTVGPSPPPPTGGLRP